MSKTLDEKKAEILKRCFKDLSQIAELVRLTLAGETRSSPAAKSVFEAIKEIQNLLSSLTKGPAFFAHAQKSSKKIEEKPEFPPPPKPK